ncbi:MAG: response regulator [Calditrichaceae bacterium]
MIKILIVEDERSIRQALRFELEDEGYEVVYATDFHEAVSAFRAFNFDLVLADLFLTRGDGIQLMDLVKKSEKEIPFIAITAFPESDLAMQAKYILKDRFFEKPFYVPALKDKVNQLLNIGQPASIAV